MQVLQKALDVFGLSCQNLDSPECMESAQHPENEVAFICNLRVSSGYLMRPAYTTCAPEAKAHDMHLQATDVRLGCMPACSAGCRNII